MTATTTAPVRPRRAVALAVEHGVDDFYQGVVPALVPLLIVVRHYDYTRAGGIVLAATLLSSVAQPLFGMLADRVSTPWLRTAGMLTAGAGIGAVGLVDSYPATWCAVLISGLGVAAYHPEAARAVHATHTADRGMGWFSFGGLAGFAAGAPVTIAVLGTLGLTASPLLVLPAVTTALVTVAAALHERGTRSDHATPPHQATAAPVSHRATEDWRRFGWLTAVVMVRSVLYYGISVFLVVYLTSHLAADTATAAIALSAFTAVGALSVLVSSRITARLGRAPTLVASYLAALAALAALLAAPTPAPAIVSVGVLGAALNIPVPVHTTLGQAYLPRHLGLASAVTLGLAVSTGGIASPVLGALADHHGVTTTLTALLVLPALAAALTVPLWAARARSQ